MYIVTGAAGFIGSTFVWALNKRGIFDILMVDTVDHDEKEHNVAELRYEELVSGDEFRTKLAAGDYDSADVKAIIHMGAISATTEKSWEKLKRENVEFTQEIIRWCADRGVRCLYASSGQVYGDGELGYSDDHDLFDQFKTITLYGKSKLDVDIWARDGGYLDKVVGLRFFNVFGPNEWHKEHMRSVINKQWDAVAKDEPMKLFKSDVPKFADGGQMRDFVYVKDAVDASLWFLDNPEVNGVFNIGTGIARTWNDVAKAMFTAAGKKPKIEYVDIPDVLKGHYQSYTLADTTKLKAVGYKKPFSSLEDSITDYVQHYLMPHVHLSS
ncbi:MAG: ADP-glyceromanno-heptose 6-epimerase [Candidatus Andersenbacteria bacterium]|nr:ADP-glyceromanno-heptose 6-epimerase [Candidatus Andersenbacteria bacterium]